MYSWQNNMCRITTFREIDLSVFIAVLLQRIVSTPTISKYRGTWFYRIAGKSNQIPSRSIRYALHSYSPKSLWFIYFNSNYNDRFSSGTPTALTIMLFTANQSFIYFYISTKTLTFRTHHSKAHLMKPTPGSLVATKAKDTLKTQCITPKFLTCYIPHRLKPQLEGFPCSLEYRAGNNGYFVLASCTTDQSSVCMPALSSMAYRTDKTIRPTKPLKINDAGFLCKEPLVKLLQSSRIIYSANWKGIIIAHELTIALRQRNGYPIFQKQKRLAAAELSRQLAFCNPILGD